MDVFLSKVTSRGQVTIPQELRLEEEITSDDYVSMRKVGNFIVMSKAAFRMTEITRAFEKQARAKKISKADVLSELESVQKSKYLK